MTNLSFLNHITFSRVRVTFRASETVMLPQYKGSTFRGCLGDALRRRVCTHPGADCDCCRQREPYAFSRLFNSYVSADHPHVRKFPKSPHPYIINPLPDDKTHYEAGDAFGFELTLIGGAVNLLPELTEAFRLMGETGIGKGHGRFEALLLESLDNSGEGYSPLRVFAPPPVFSMSQWPVPDTGNSITLMLETPLRLMKEGHPTGEPPSFGLLVSRLALRMGLLAHFHCRVPWQEFDPQLDTGDVGVTTSSSRLQWVDWQRYSGTQDRRMNFDGHIGTITYEGAISEWMPLLVAGSWLHAGSTTTFGLGKYRIL